ncbi:MAG: adenosylcobinamide-GDP ribazoletransferase [Pseudomonadota bacterium]
MRLLREVAIALIFLTRLPIKIAGSFAMEDVTRAGWAFPLAGAVVGLIGGTVMAGALWLGLPPILAAILGLSASMLVSGCLHEDGWADVCDGFGGGATAERKLEIMRDSRLGTYGAVGLILNVGFRAGSLSLITSPILAICVFVCAHALSRAAMPLVQYVTPLARQDGLAAGAGRPSVLVAGGAVFCGALSLIPLVFISLAFVGESVAFVGVVIAVQSVAVWGLRVIAVRQIGGYTGDVLGAVQQLSEMILLAGLVLVATR